MTDSIAKSYSEEVKGAKLKVSGPYPCKFAGVKGQRTTISYTTQQDDKDIGHTCVACVLNGPLDDANFTVTCVIQYPDDSKTRGLTASDKDARFHPAAAVTRTTACPQRPALFRGP